jgi:hypothetical protein
MNAYKLDDLMDWGTVLRELEALRREASLDAHQDGLARVIRYKKNWRLRESALECAREVGLPGDRLVAEICSVMCDEEAYPELRIRAAEVAADLVLKRAGGGETTLSSGGVAVPEKMRELLGAPLNPLLARTLRRVLADIEKDA